MTAVGLPAVTTPESSMSDPVAVISELEDEIDGLRRAMASRAPIEQAKGMLMVTYGLDDERAFQLLRRWSSVHNVKLRVVAAHVIEIWTLQPWPADVASAPPDLLAAALASSDDGHRETGLR